LVRKKEIQYFLLFNLAMLCISTSGVLGKQLLLSPFLSIWFRCFFAILFLGIFCLMKSYSFRLKNGQGLVMIFLSGVLMTAHWVTYFFALKHTSVAISMIAIFTYPVMTTLLEPLFFKTKLQIRSVVLSCIILVGVFYLLPDFDIAKGDTKGLLFALISALFYSFRNLILKREIVSYNGSVLMFYQALIAVTILSPMLYFFMPSYDLIMGDLPYLLALGLITTAVGHTMFLNSFEYFKISTVSIMSSLQPVFGIVLAMLFLYEFPNWRSLIGGALIIVCVLLESLFAIKSQA